MDPRAPGYALLVSLAAGALLATLAALSLLLPAPVERAAAGSSAVVTVNTALNLDDGRCNGPPNDTNPTGNCSINEAFDAVNDATAGTIRFHPSVFTPTLPGVIIIDDGRPGSVGCLPPIQRTGVVIDATNAGVILDGNNEDDGSGIACPGGAIAVRPTHHAYEFALLGGGHFTIRQFDTNGVGIDCAAGGPLFSLRSLTVSGVAFEENSGVDVFDDCSTPTPTVTNTPTRTATPTRTTTPTDTRTPTPTRTPTHTPMPRSPTVAAATATPPPFSTPTVLRGDANCDGAVDAVDAALILQHSAGVLTAPLCATADANTDGAVDSRDAALILQIISRLLPG
jgi:hypothetical protein